jgi:hypothetical protein
MEMRACLEVTSQESRRFRLRGSGMAQSSPSSPSCMAPAPAATAPSPLEAYVASLNPDTMSPREAMDAIYQLTSLIGVRT